jgi:uncharacterized protein (DUF934 family)
MPQLIKDRAVVDDPWTLLREASSLADVPDVPVIVPLALWLARRAALHARGEVGVWLAPTDDPAALAPDVGVLPLIAVDFPKFTDGRGYSIARLLRDPLWASGASSGHRRRAARPALRDVRMRIRRFLDTRRPRPAQGRCRARRFSSVYTSTSRTPQPWFRRRDGADAAAAAKGDLARARPMCSRG